MKLEKCFKINLIIFVLDLKKTPKLSIDDWVIAVTSWGIPADAVA